MTEEQKAKCHAIIHTVSVACGRVAQDYDLGYRKIHLGFFVSRDKGTGYCPSLLA